MPILSSQFWLEPQPTILTAPSRTSLLVFIGALLLLSIASFILKRRKGFYRQLWGKLVNFSLTNTMIGAVLFFFNHEQIPFLSARFWYLLWGAGLVVWAVFIIRYSKKLPEKRKELIREAEYKKYLP
jgi:LPXTG-motif cell wall-anchored protein